MKDVPIGGPLSEEWLKQVREHHEEQSRRRAEEYLIWEVIPELQEHPKVQAGWPQVSHEELKAMNLEELKELRTTYRLTIEDQI